MARLRFPKPVKLAAVRSPGHLPVWKPLSVIEINLPTKDVPAAKAAWERHGEKGLEPWRLTAHRARREAEDRLLDLFRAAENLARFKDYLKPVAPAPVRKLHPFKSMPDYQAWLKRRGFVRLGGGAYGSVWGKPGQSWVLKMGANPSDGWPAYAALVMEKHADNPFAPRIKSLRWHGAFYVAVMERLGDVIAAREPDFSFIGKPLGETDPLWKLYVAARAAVSDFTPRRGVVSLALLQRRHPDLYRLVQDIRRDLVPASHLDFHEGNVMVDLEGKRLVVTDPISSTSLDTRSLSTRRSRLTAA